MLYIVLQSVMLIACRLLCQRVVLKLSLKIIVFWVQFFSDDGQGKNSRNEACRQKWRRLQSGSDRLPSLSITLLGAQRCKGYTRVHPTASSVNCTKLSLRLTAKLPDIYWDSNNSNTYFFIPVSIRAREM